MLKRGLSAIGMIKICMGVIVYIYFGQNVNVFILEGLVLEVVVHKYISRNIGFGQSPELIHISLVVKDNFRWLNASPLIFLILKIIK